MELIQTSPLKREHGAQLVKLIDSATPYRSSQQTLEQRLTRNKAESRAFKAGWGAVTIAAFAIVGLIVRHM